MSCNGLVKVATVSKYHVYLGNKASCYLWFIHNQNKLSPWWTSNRLPHFTSSDQIFIRWFQIRFEIVLLLSLHKVVWSISWYDITWMAAHKKEAKCMFSSSKSSMSARNCFFLMAQIFAEIVMPKKFSVLCVHLLYLEWTHKTHSDMDLWCLCESVKMEIATSQYELGVSKRRSRSYNCSCIWAVRGEGP